MKFFKKKVYDFVTLCCISLKALSPDASGISNTGKLLPQSSEGRRPSRSRRTSTPTPTPSRLPLPSGPPSLGSLREGPAATAADDAAAADDDDDDAAAAAAIGAADGLSRLRMLLPDLLLHIFTFRTVVNAFQRKSRVMCSTFVYTFLRSPKLQANIFKYIYIIASKFKMIKKVKVFKQFHPELATRVGKVKLIKK